MAVVENRYFVVFDNRISDLISHLEPQKTASRGTSVQSPSVPSRSWANVRHLRAVGRRVGGLATTKVPLSLS